MGCCKGNVIKCALAGWLTCLEWMRLLVHFQGRSLCPRAANAVIYSLSRLCSLLCVLLI